MSILYPVDSEKKWFEEQEAQKLQQLREQYQKEQNDKKRADEQKLHYMRCPKCGAQLTEIRIMDVLVDKCFSCEGLWLDVGELEQLTQDQEGTLFERITRVLKK